MSINEYNYGIIYDAEKELETSYEMAIDDDNFRGYIRDETIIEMIEDLTNKIKDLKEKLEKQQETFDEKINDFYKPKSPYEIYGVNEDMFH